MTNSIAALVVNHMTACLTIECVKSIAAAGVRRVLVLDNGSDEADWRILEAGLVGIEVELLKIEDNLGFAHGCNLLFERVLFDDEIQHVLLLNSDAVLVNNGLELLRTAAERAPMVCGRVDFHPDSMRRNELESIGITLYRSLLASNRKHPTDILLGPTGACALYATSLLRELWEFHGYIFDPDYFCYAEDTDLCLRARMLGHDTDCVEECVAWHWGQASSGGGYSDFILFHGIRNSIWTLIKTTPAARVLKYFPWLLSLHIGIVVRHLCRGKFSVLARLYYSALLGIPDALRKRSRIQSTSRISAVEFDALVTPSFYERDYVRKAIMEILPGSRGP